MFTAYGNGEVAVSESTCDAVFYLVYEKVWLPLQGFTEDETEKSAWVDLKKVMIEMGVK